MKPSLLLIIVLLCNTYFIGNAQQLIDFFPNPYVHDSFDVDADGVLDLNGIETSPDPYVQNHYYSFYNMALEMPVQNGYVKSMNEDASFDPETLNWQDTLVPLYKSNYSSMSAINHADSVVFYWPYRIAKGAGIYQYGFMRLYLHPTSAYNFFVNELILYNVGVIPQTVGQGGTKHITDINVIQGSSRQEEGRWRLAAQYPKKSESADSVYFYLLPADSTHLIQEELTNPLFTQTQFTTGDFNLDTLLPRATADCFGTPIIGERKYVVMARIYYDSEQYNNLSGPFSYKYYTETPVLDTVYANLQIDGSYNITINFSCPDSTQRNEKYDLIFTEAGTNKTYSYQVSTPDSYKINSNNFKDSTGTALRTLRTYKLKIKAIPKTTEGINQATFSNTKEIDLYRLTTLPDTLLIGWHCSPDSLMMKIYPEFLNMDSKNIYRLAFVPALSGSLPTYSELKDQSSHTYLLQPNDTLELVEPEIRDYRNNPLLFNVSYMPVVLASAVLPYADSSSFQNQKIFWADSMGNNSLISGVFPEDSTKHLKDIPVLCGIWRSNVTHYVDIDNDQTADILAQINSSSSPSHSSNSVTISFLNGWKVAVSGNRVHSSPAYFTMPDTLAFSSSKYEISGYFSGIPPLSSSNYSYSLPFEYIFLKSETKWAWLKINSQSSCLIIDTGVVMNTPKYVLIADSSDCVAKSIPEEPEKHREDIVYPNPTSDFLYLQSSSHGELDYSLYNATGTMVDGGLWPPTGLNMAKFSSGIYLLKLSGNDIMLTQRVIKR